MKDLPEIRVRSGTFWVKLYFSEISIWGGPDRDTVVIPKNILCLPNALFSNQRKVSFSGGPSQHVIS
jgi:hypothetical protein